MDLLDLVIVLLIAGALASGWRRGLTWVGLSFAGLIAGVVVGALIAPPIAHRIAEHDPQTQALIGAGVFLTAVALIQGIGTAVGYQIRIVALRTEFATVDSGFGAGLAALGVLVGAWYLGLTFAFSPFTGLDVQIRNSAILRALDDIAPRPPAFLGQLENLLRGSNFPNPFAGLAPENLTPVQLPADISTPGIRAAAAVTSKVYSDGCGREAGSSWPLAVDYLVTNAHVVAGGQSIHVVTPDGSTHAADVVLFDPEVDVAILHVPRVGLTPLTVFGGDPDRGTQGAVIGYPNGGDERVVEAAVRGEEQARGFDIYGSNTVTRTIEVLDAQVIPGNSGGPMVDLNGRVVGLVFAASTVDPNEGYALANSEIKADLAAGPGRTTAVSTGDCTS